MLLQQPSQFLDVVSTYLPRPSYYIWFIDVPSGSLSTPLSSLNNKYFFKSSLNSEALASEFKENLEETLHVVDFSILWIWSFVPSFISDKCLIQFSSHNRPSLRQVDVVKSQLYRISVGTIWYCFQLHATVYYETIAFKSRFDPQMYLRGLT